MITMTIVGESSWRKRFSFYWQIWRLTLTISVVMILVKNKLFYNTYSAKGYNVKLEFSGPRTPQQNGKVERKFQAFYDRIRAILNNAGLQNSDTSGI
jgi:hypothetical protein